MRRKPIKGGVIALILAGIYLLGLLLGVWLISYLPSQAKRAGLVGMVEGMAQRYVQSGQADPSPMSGAAAVVYGPDGELLDYFQSTHRINQDFAAQGRRDLPEILRGRSTLRLVLFAPDNSTLGYTSLVYVGVPLVADGEVVGAFLWVRELHDLLESILGYVCAFTFVFALAAVFMGLCLRNQRRYERLRRHYVDNITHELKTPVASIKALAEALSDGMEKNAGDRSVYYGMILREANRQERMICDALELSKLQSHSNPTVRQPVGAAEVFGPVCEKYAVLCDLMGVTFTGAEQLQALPELMTDPKYLPVVLDALLSNALKFVGEDGTITLSAQTARRRATVCVADNGRGIPPEEQSKVFERFYKGGGGDNEAGSGLGLSIAREILYSLGEKIWIRSREGAGTQVCFTVALRRTARIRPEGR